MNIKGVTKCCNEHDFCYDTCNNSKDSCDKVFKKCVERLCKKLKDVVTHDIYEGNYSRTLLYFFVQVCKIIES